MPIRPENKDRYPTDWPQISNAVRERAGQCCEFCGVRNHAMIRRGAFIMADGTARPCFVYADEEFFTELSDVYDAETGKRLGMYADMEPPKGKSDFKDTKVILTAMHLDHQPENCEPNNLKAGCQRCHNAYDAPMRRAGIQARKKAKMAAGDLFDEVQA